ncbi:hypothetical protein [Inquilinus limosus]|uniref:hypothetical protein n=1 Tax=Inquilinus limosus TaxID=171674 RepID=UPI00068ECA40|nr:hypothetical protein [Inquilinus limosus]
MPEQTNRTHPTTQQLLRDINRGLTGDKIAAQDPAAAPLGTDDEAAGMPPSPEEVGDAREREAIGRPPDMSLMRGDQGVDRRRAPGSLMHVSALAAVLALLLAVALALGLLGLA